MKIFAKVMVITAAVIVAALFIGFAAAGFSWDNVKAAFNADEDFTLEVEEGAWDFTAVEFDLESNSVEILPSDDGNFSISYYHSEYYIMEYGTDDGVLSLSGEYKRGYFWKWLKATSAKVSTVTLRVPAGSAFAADIDTVNGRITVEDTVLESGSFSAVNGRVSIKDCQVSGELIISATNGLVNVEGVQAYRVNVNTVNGAITLKNVTAEQDVDCGTVNGMVSLTNISAGSAAKAATTTGAVVISDSSAPLISGMTVNGEVKLTGVTGQSIKAKTTNGSVTAKVSGSADSFSAKVSTVSGSIYVDGVKLGSQTLNPSAPYSLECTTVNGSVTVNFIEGN